MKLSNIQPTQLYISSEKLSKILHGMKAKIAFHEPVPIKELNGKIIYTDGHTRALATYLQGGDDIDVCWEDEKLDWDEYQVCVDWCLAEGIRTIADLSGRIIDPESYQTLWLDRCGKMHEDIENRRKGL
ncbi:MAG: hypothetical protein HZB92_05965 [Euryarchaeota archaeon]|nr:hypothetical protein [Euryarchaeota archaeon]